jgi:class III poly(R)-hydroxyalkanoic acid synthase PhaE subunit
MSTDTNNDPLGWAAAVQKTQAELMQQWSELNNAWARSAAGAAAASGGAGSPGSASQTLGADIARKFMAQFEQYLGVTRALWELIGRAAAVSDAEQRTRVFNEGLSSLQHQFAGQWAATPFGAPLGAAAAPFGFGAMPGFGGAGPSGAFGQWPFAAAGGAPTAGWPGALQMPGLDWPALGPAREQQERWQRLAQTAGRCAQAQLKLAGLWNEIIANALRELGGNLAPRLQSGATPQSMKEVYDLWVDAAESVYARAAHGAAFIAAQAELGNAVSQLRITQRELIEDWARQFDLPTRAELNGLHQQIRELKAALNRGSG